MKAKAQFKAKIPLTRDPFVNTPLLNLGKGDNGKERFWISSYNANVGSTGVLIDEDGEYRTYDFPLPHAGFYSAALEGRDKLWLCGKLEQILCLDLKSGKFDVYETGAPSALVFEGMCFDTKSKKIFVMGYPGDATTAVSFDTKSKKSVKVYRDICPDHFMRFHFPDGKGGYSFVMHTPGQSFVHWDPKNEKVDYTRFSKTRKVTWAGGTTYTLVNDTRGRYYVPEHGWYDPKSRKFDRKGPKPQREMTWFKRIGNRAYGFSMEDLDNEVGVWDLKSGKVKSLTVFPQTHMLNVNVSRRGDIYCVNMFGELFIADGQSGELKLNRSLPTNKPGHIDCLVRIDKHRLLGTPFITQRFWELDLKSGKGIDRGRAAPNDGEVLLDWKIKDKVYMAAYTSGSLVEYDPQKISHYPENPRVVASPDSAMRPVAKTQNGHTLFYACSKKYGQLGGVLTSYNTRTRQAKYLHDPLGDQQISGLQYHHQRKILYGSTTPVADCNSAPTSSNRCYLFTLDPDLTKVGAKIQAPKGTKRVYLPGWLKKDLLLAFFDIPGAPLWAGIDVRDFKKPIDAKVLISETYYPGWRCAVFFPTEFLGKFVIHKDDNIELWDLNKNQRARVLVENAPPHFKYKDGSLYLIHQKHIEVYDNIL